MLDRNIVCCIDSFHRGTSLQLVQLDLASRLARHMADGAFIRCC